MANRYTYQFNGSFKPRMSQIEGFVSVGTGGLVNAATASGTVYGELPGNVGVLGIPTGWVGGFSGTIGLYGAGVSSVSRISTGTYNVLLTDGWVRSDSVNVEYYTGASGGLALSSAVSANTVGEGNTNTATQNTITVQFQSPITGVGVDIPSGGGFYIFLRLRDTTAGPQ